MLTRKPRYTKVEHARLGTEIYEQRVSSQLSPDQFGKIVAIDVESGEFEVADQTVAAAQRLMARRPDAQIWFVRIGHQGVHRFGVGRLGA